MKRRREFLFCLACGLALSASLLAKSAVLRDNPYAAIVTRNVFGLNPPVPAVVTTSTDPPPKITPNGIMSVFGRTAVLFKVAESNKQGRPANEEYYNLGEGERKDDIEVTHVDEKDGIVTFNNHGTVQQIPLAAVPALTAPASFVSNPNAVPAMLAPVNDVGSAGRRYSRRG